MGSDRQTAASDQPAAHRQVALGSANAEALARFHSAPYRSIAAISLSVTLVIARAAQVHLQ